MITRSVILIKLILTALVLSACSTGPFSGAASMRIEVEVYKGPLSLEPQMQLAELHGYLIDTQGAVLNNLGFIQDTARALGFSDAGPETPFSDPAKWCSNTGANLKPAALLDCTDLRRMNYDARSSLTQIDIALGYFRKDSNTTLNYKTLENFKSLDEGPYKDIPIGDETSDNKRFTYNKTTLDKILYSIKKAATSMQATAAQYATPEIAGQSPDNLLRIATVTFIVTLSEYGNQLQARADALAKQIGESGKDRRELPLSTHLRETEPTEFMNLYKWLGATTNDFHNYVFVGSGSVKDRIKIINRLYSDRYWSRVNSVDASGRGKTQMAFIKDEIGNWNLKSFDNDPSELLDAYTQVGKTALAGAVQVSKRLAADGFSGGGAELAQQLLSLANQTTLAKQPQSTSTPGSISLDHLRDRIAEQFDNAHTKTFLSKEADLMARVTSAKQTLATAEQSSDQSQINTAKTALEQNLSNLAKYRKEVIARWTTLVDDHSDLVDIVSSTVKKK